MDRLLEYLVSFMRNSDTIDAIYVTLVLGVCSTTISAFCGINLGLWLERHAFKGKKLVLRINRTFMGIPPVVVGLMVYMLIMRRGPLGDFRMLFSIRAMILAQVIIITPIICGLVYTSAQRMVPSVRFFATCIGASRNQTKSLIRKEMSKEIYFAIITGFGRSISEVGAVMLVGGNIKYHTRTMTTTISLLKSQGIYTDGIMLGILLLLMSFAIQLIADALRKEKVEIDNY